MRITSLIKLTLGEKCAHASFPVTCLNLDETAAEKWVALTRRIAETERRKPRANDKHLVRHLYDLYHLKKHNYLSGQYKKIIAKIMQRDGDIFKKRNTDYAFNPLKISVRGLQLLRDDPQWSQHWEKFTEEMVYETNPPVFLAALDQLQTMSKTIFEDLKIAA